MRKARTPGIQHFLCKTGLLTLDKDFNPLGFDFLACQVGQQYLSANLSGFWRSNASKEMCFWKAECPVQMKGWVGCCLRESIFSLCVLRSSINGSPISLRTHCPPLGLPVPSLKSAKPQQRQLCDLLPPLCWSHPPNTSFLSSLLWIVM